MRRTRMKMQARRARMTDGANVTIDTPKKLYVFRLLTVLRRARLWTMHAPESFVRCECSVRSAMLRV